MILPQVATIRNNIVLQAEKERREKAAKQERRKLAERQDLERRRRDAEGFERSLRKKLSVGDLLTMHKEGRSYSDETILQVVELNKDESGNLHSITLSDGEYVSHNIKTLPSSPFCYHYIFSVEYVAKVITISRINSQKKFTVQTFAQKLYCFKNSPLGGAIIDCKHLQF